MPTQRLTDYLEYEDVAYETIAHAAAYTAQGVAAAAHVPGQEVAKSTVVKIDGRFALAVLPAHKKVDLKALGRLAGGKVVSLASEAELVGLFPQCELGAMPPFGNLYGLPVWVDESLAKDITIVFNAGSHREAIRMAFADFRRLVTPRFGAFASR
jgi:Ala-tRNA(Pro) deacylase